ncbi:MAG TPA: hypothetical protein VFE67_13035 [Rudaea sp.]|nr:hypothetical protein [Rudaea sp.]
MENVDRVVAMLNDAGIATSVTNRRAYAGHDYRRPSYAKPPDRETWPQVWVVNADDQSRARALLRDAGVEPPTRFADELAEARGNVSPEARRKALVWRLRVFLLAVIITLVVLNAAGVLKLY